MARHTVIEYHVPAAPEEGVTTRLDDRPNTALFVIDVRNGVVGQACDRDGAVVNVSTLVDKARAAGVDGL